MPPTDPKTPIEERLDEVEALRNLNDRSWSLKAGLSEGYLATQRVRAEKEPGFVRRIVGAFALILSAA